MKKNCKSNMSENFKRKSALHYALGGEVTKPASQGILAQPLAQRAAMLDNPEAAPIMPNVAPMAPPATALNPGVPTLTNQELGRLGKNAAGTAPPTFWGAFKDRYGLGPSGYAHGGMVYSIPGEPGTATFPMHGAAGPSQMDLGAAALPGMDNPLRRGFQAGGMVPPARPQPVVAPPSILAPPAMPVAPPVAPPPVAPPPVAAPPVAPALRPGRLAPPTTPFNYRNPYPSVDVVEGATRGSKGGPVTDPGKGFPDEQGEDKHHIVVAAGEYVLPNATVDALGGAAALDKIVEATNGAPPNKLTGSNALRQYERGGPGPIYYEPVKPEAPRQYYQAPNPPPPDPRLSGLQAPGVAGRDFAPKFTNVAEQAAADRARHQAAAGVTPEKLAKAAQWGSAQAGPPAPTPAPAAPGPMIADDVLKAGVEGAKATAGPAPTTAAGKAGAFAKSAGEKAVGAAKAVKGAAGNLAGWPMRVAGSLAATGALGYAGYKGMRETTDEQAQRVGADTSPETSRNVGQRVDSALRGNPYTAPLYNAIMPPDRAHADEYTLGRDIAIRGAGYADNMTGGALGGARKAWERAGGGAPQPAGAGNEQATRGGISPEEAARGDVRPEPQLDWSQTGQRNPNPLRSSRVGNHVTITDGSTPEQQRNAMAFVDRQATALRAAEARDRATNPRYDPANIAAEHAAISAKYAASGPTPGTIATSDGREVPIQSIEGKLIAGAQNRRMLAESPLRTAQIQSSTQRRGQDLVYDAAVQHRALERQLAMQRAKIEQFNKDRDYNATRSDRAFEQDEKRTEAYNKALDAVFIQKGPKGEELGREQRTRANELILGTLQQAGLDPRAASAADFAEMARLAQLELGTEANREGVKGALKTWITGPYAKAQGLQSRRGPVRIEKGALYDTVVLPDGRTMSRREYEHGDPNLIINAPAHQRELDVLSDAYGRLRNR